MPTNISNNVSSAVRPSLKTTSPSQTLNLKADQQKINTDQLLAEEDQRRMNKEQRKIAEEDQRRASLKQREAANVEQRRMVDEDRRMANDQRRMNAQMRANSQRQMSQSMIPQLNMFPQSQRQMNIMPQQFSQQFPQQMYPNSRMSQMNIMPQQMYPNSRMPQQSPQFNMIPQPSTSLASQQMSQRQMIPQMSQRQMNIMPPTQQMNFPQQDFPQQSEQMSPQGTPMWQREFGKTYNPRELHEKYEQLREENPDRHGELNHLWEQARGDIKKRMKRNPKPVVEGKPSQTGATDVSKIDPKVLIPGDTLEQVTSAYKTRKAAAIAKGRPKMAAALDRAFEIRKREFTGKSPSSVGKKSVGKKSPLKLGAPETGTDFSKMSPEKLVPGNTLHDIDASYKARKAAAVAKGRTQLAAALNRAYVIRKKQLQSQPIKKPIGQQKYSGLSKVPNSVLIPGKTPQEIEVEYKRRREAAVKKQRLGLVAALDAAHARLISGKPRTPSAKSPQAKSPQVKSPQAKAPQAKSPQAKSPQAKSPQAKSPQAKSPQAKSPQAKSPQGGSTSPQGGSTSPTKSRSPQGQLVAGKKVASPSATGDWKKTFAGVDHSNPRAVSEKYQAMRKVAKSEDVGKLNASFKQAIRDIKLSKRPPAKPSSQLKSMSPKPSSQKPMKPTSPKPMKPTSQKPVSSKSMSPLKPSQLAIRKAFTRAERGTSPKPMSPKPMSPKPLSPPKSGQRSPGQQLAIQKQKQRATQQQLAQKQSVEKQSKQKQEVEKERRIIEKQQEAKRTKELKMSEKQKIEERKRQEEIQREQKKRMERLKRSEMKKEKMRRAEAEKRKVEESRMAEKRTLEARKIRSRQVRRAPMRSMSPIRRRR
jgi:hypothetical protein